MGVTLEFLPRNILIIKEKKTFNRLNIYIGTEESERLSLCQEHREAFELDHPLTPTEFNQRQHIYVVGNAANDELINAVNYWKKAGLSLDFLPYRIYEIGEEYFFEFFALPYDRHLNPADIKGVLLIPIEAMTKMLYGK